MSTWTGAVASWLAVVYALATIVLAASALAMLGIRQPARRLMVARSALIALVAVAPIAAATPSPRETCPCPGAHGPRVLAATWPDGIKDRLGAILAAFAAGSAAMAAWLVVGAMASARLTLRARPAPRRLVRILERIAAKEGRRAPRLVVCPVVPHPVAVGLIRPTIVLPAAFVEEEPAGRIEAALVHEWAHLRNGDLRMLAVSRLLLPLLFAHPLFAWLRRRVRDDQEALADAAAASARGGRVAYAEALVGWSSGARRPNRLAPALGLWGRRPSLARRVARLLDRDFHVEPTCPSPWRLGVPAATAAIVAGLALGLHSGAPWLTPAPTHHTSGGRRPPRTIEVFLCPPDAKALDAMVRCEN